MPKFIFLNMPPTPNDRQISDLPEYFFLGPGRPWNVEQFDFKVAFATDHRWSIWAGIGPCIGITWRDKQLFKSCRQIYWNKSDIYEPQRTDENRIVRSWDHEFSNKGENACSMKYVILHYKLMFLKLDFWFEYRSEQLNCESPELKLCRFDDL